MDQSTDRRSGWLFLEMIKNLALIMRRPLHLWSKWLLCALFLPLLHLNLGKYTKWMLKTHSSIVTSKRKFTSNFLPVCLHLCLMLLTNWSVLYMDWNKHQVYGLKSFTQHCLIFPSYKTGLIRHFSYKGA